MIFENCDRIVFEVDSVTNMGSAQPIGERLLLLTGSTVYNMNK